MRRAVAGAILAAGLLGTGAAAYVATHGPVVYWSSVPVRLVPPSSELVPNGLAVSVTALPMTANALANAVDPRDRARPVSPTVSIVDEGITDGWAVTVPNRGGQFNATYRDAYVVVQAAGPTPAAVHRRMVGLLARIDTTLARLQAAQDVPPGQLIHTVRAIADPPVAAAKGSPARAVAASIAIGAALTLAALSGFTRRVRRRRP